MTILSKSKSAQAPAADQGAGFPLPDGYDDEHGPFYVHERLREAWAVHADNADTQFRIGRVARAIADQRALVRARPEEFEAKEKREFVRNDGGGHDVVYRQVPAAGKHLLAGAVLAAAAKSRPLFVETREGAEAAERILEGEAESIEAEAKHAMRLHHVITEFSREEKEREAVASKDRRLHCPVCGQSDARLGGPSGREIVPAGAGMWGRKIMLVSCGGCYLAAVDILTAKHAHAAIDESGTTRADRVAAHFESKGI
ncbi:MAG: hypothetical protein KJ659_00935 [Actinobacteria bacterium]|nr:hypothetical protein [Actinomycetota bacterium]MBU1608924.1 hypothetical protein [Actinomycetota bacterium]MBU2316365.1 hypothetical protein [Actinomycetota bacterium]MBU2384055.1 hypothetical protein [Actinomycetota bacterium]